MPRILVFLLMILISCNSWGFSYTVEFTEQQIQQQLSRLMPFKKEEMFVTIIVSDPTIELGKPDGTIGVFANLQAQAPGGIRGSGKTKITGNLSYKKETGSFYLNNPKIAHIEIDQIPSQFHDNIRKLAQFALSSAVENKALFTLKDDNAQQQLAKSTLQSVKIIPGKLVVTLAMDQKQTID